MTDRDAIQLLKLEYQKHRADFYPDVRQALEKAINALYEREQRDGITIKESDSIKTTKTTINRRPFYKRGERDD